MASRILPNNGVGNEGNWGPTRLELLARAEENRGPLVAQELQLCQSSQGGNATQTIAFARSVGVGRYGGVPTGIPTNDFFSLATAQLNRGFKYLTPLHPSTKRPAIRGYNKRAPTTHEDIRKWSEKFPDYGCGIVCR